MNDWELGAPRVLGWLEQGLDGTSSRTTFLADAKILVVDDQDVNVLLLKRVLENAGVGQVLGVPSAARAFEALDRFSPDLVMLDWHMPGLSGRDLVESVKARSTARGFVPVIVLTADATQDVRLSALEAGATDFLTKPFDHTEVVLRVRNLLELGALYRRSVSTAEF